MQIIVSILFKKGAMGEESQEIDFDFDFSWTDEDISVFKKRINKQLDEMIAEATEGQ